MRVAAGAIARKILGCSIVIRAAVSQIGDLAVSPERWSWDACSVENLFCPDIEILASWHSSLDAARRAGTSLGRSY